MLGKLLKHELSQSARTLVPLYAGTTVALLLTKLMMVLSDQFSKPTPVGERVEVAYSPVLAVLSVAMTSIFTVLMLALLCGTVAVAVQRFYRVLGDEGYVMFALPVTPAQHIASKTICGMAWVVASALYLGASVWVMLFTNKEPIPFHWGPVANDYLLIALMLLCMLVGALASLWMMYLSCVIGARFGQNRLVASIGAFFVLQMALQILGTVALFIFGNSDMLPVANLLVNLQANPLGVIKIVFGAMLGMLVLFSAIFYAATHYHLQKKLNLA